MATVFLRTLIIYIVLIAAMRVMGKRQLGELELPELVITLMLSELAVIPISDKNIPVAYAIIPIFLLLSLEVITSFFISKSSYLKKILVGKPSIIIKDGKIDQKELARLRIGANELMCELRQKNIAAPEDVQYAIVEENGKMSVFPKTEKQPATPEDLGIKVERTGIAQPVVINGKINPASLTLTGLSEKKLYRIISGRNMDIADIFLMTIDDSENVCIVIKENIS